MEINVRESSSIRILDISGRMDTGTSPAVEIGINQVLDAGIKKIILNLASTEYVSSSGLRVLLITAKKLAASGGSLKICQPNSVVREILDISGFSTFLDVRTTEEEALSEMQF
jgi:anti-sigma B factor antagonist